MTKEAPTKLALLIWSALFLAQLPLLFVYFSGLIQMPKYGWPVLFPVLVTVILFAVRWDRRLRLPAGTPVFALLLTGLSIGFLGGILGSPWLAYLGFCIFSCAFFAAQRSWQNLGSLATLSPILFGCLRMPLAIGQLIDSRLLESSGLIAGSVLDFLKLPYLEDATVWSFPGERVYAFELFQSIDSWPLFVAASLALSAYWQRHLFEVILGLLGAIVSTLVNCSSQLVCICYFATQSPEEFDFESALWKIKLCCFILSLLFYLSIERLIIGFLAPIRDGSEDARQVNPLVVGWNAIRNLRPFPAVQKQAEGFKFSSLFIFFAIAMATVEFFALLKMRPEKDAAQVGLGLDRATIFKVWDDTESVDYFGPKGSQAEYRWINYLPTRTTTLASRLVDDSTSVAFSIPENGWEIVGEPKDVEITSPSGNIIKAVELELKSQSRSALSISAAIPLRPNDEVSTQNYALVSSFSKFNTKTNDRNKLAISEEFAKWSEILLGEIQLVDGQKEVEENL